MLYQEKLLPSWGSENLFDMGSQHVGQGSNLKPSPIKDTWKLKFAEKYRQVAPSNGQAITSVIGRVEFNRFRPTNRSRRELYPQQSIRSIDRRRPDTGRRQVWACRSSAADRSLKAHPIRWKRFTGEKLSRSHSGAMCGCGQTVLEGCSTERMARTSKIRKNCPKVPLWFILGLTGSSAHECREAPTEVIEKQVAVRRHVVNTVRDDDENRLQSRYIGRLPEGKKESQITNPQGSEPFTEPESGPEAGGHRRWCKRQLDVLQKPQPRCKCRSRSLLMPLLPLSDSSPSTTQTWMPSGICVSAEDFRTTAA